MVQAKTKVPRFARDDTPLLQAAIKNQQFLSVPAIFAA
jgi:hypothetical protein